jgi:hypothetical protein
MAPYLRGLNLDDPDVVVPTTEHGDVDALNNAHHNLLHSLARVILQKSQRLRKKIGFLNESSYQTLIIPLAPLQIFQKVAKIFVVQGALLISTIQAAS